MKHLAGLIIILLLGAGLRFHASGQDFRLHPDEAFFSTFARNAAVQGQWMLPGALDKTPLTVYASALSMHLTAAYATEQNIIEVDIRQGEFATRLPNTFASIILIALTHTLTWQITYRQRPALIAASIAAFSPYLIVFSASAFTDVLMVLFMMLALLMSLRGRLVWSGVFLALSFASKQQGVLYLPLILAVMWSQHRLTRRNLTQCILAFSSGVLIVLLWDAARPEDSVFAIASANNNPERLFVTSGEWLPRLRVWLRHAGWILGPPVLTYALIAGALAISWVYKRHITIQRTNLVFILAGYVLIYGLAHWLLAFNTYDRYLLPIALLVIVLVSIGLIPLFTQLSKLQSLLRAALPILTITVMSLLFFTGYGASRGQIDIGRNGYPRQTDVIEIAGYLNAKPLGAIIYDPWMGWEMGYYLGAWTDKRRVYYPEPEIVVLDAPRNPDTAPRYLIAPKNTHYTAWLNAFDAIGFITTLAYETHQTLIYQIIPN